MGGLCQHQVYDTPGYGVVCGFLAGHPQIKAHVYKLRHSEKKVWYIAHVGFGVSWGIVTTGKGRRIVPRGREGCAGGRGKRVVPGVILLFWSVVTTDQGCGVVLGAKRVVLKKNYDRRSAHV